MPVNNPAKGVFVPLQTKTPELTVGLQLNHPDHAGILPPETVPTLKLNTKRHDLSGAGPKQH